MSGVTGIGQATNTLPPKMHPRAKAISDLLTADWFWALCILMASALAPSPSVNASTVLGLPKLCLFRNVTGIACPGCGMTRSLIATGHGHLENALAFHPLGPAIFVLLAIGVVVGINDCLPNPKCVLQGLKRLLRIPLIICAAGFAVVWILRLMQAIPTPP